MLKALKINRFLQNKAENGGTFLTIMPVFLRFSLAGCLLDFLKTDVGKKLNVNKLIDMAAQVNTRRNFLRRHSRFQHLW